MGLTNFRTHKAKIKLNQMTIIYKIKPNDTRIKLFGKKFVENNKKKCKILINNNLQEIIEDFPIDETIKQKDKLEIKLFETNPINKMSGIFTNCKSLISLPDISEWDFKNVTDMSTMFSYCENIVTLPDISKWDISKVINMSGLFSHCISLISLPNIGKWNTKNVDDMSWLFAFCSNLKKFQSFYLWDWSQIILFLMYFFV